MFRNRADQLTAFIGIAALFGGGGVAYGLANLVIQLAALALLALHYPVVRQFFENAPRTLIGVLLASLLLPLLQLVPLPPSVWTAMPGRDLLKEALTAAGDVGWFATTVNSGRTFVAFLGLLAPAAVIVLAWRGPGNTVPRMTLVFIIFGLLNVLLGAMQILGPKHFGMFYVENDMPGVLFGLFANRNSTGVFLVCCLVLLATLPPVRLSSVAGIAKIVAAVLLVTGVILTQSRSSIALMLVPLAFSTVRLVALRFERSAHARKDAKSVPGSRIVTAAFLAVAAFCAVLVPMMGGSRIDDVLARFNRSEEQRPSIWEDARYSASRYWPVGSGMATFDEVFQADESLEYVSARRAGRAHNDYIEIAIEAGAFGLAIVAAWALWAFVAAWQALSTPRRWPALGGQCILVTIALQSILDYPLRNQTMLCLAAFAVVLLAPLARRPAEPVDQTGAAA
ncbi:MAG: hypothetical protein C0409_01985 [Novosphingobium sp.]|nr:hypothetical protein [Novosphingobium sp.]